MTDTNNTQHTGDLRTSVFTAKVEENPLFDQYKEMKRKHPDAILLFRVGDFYECFKEDAIRVSDILNLNLVKSKSGFNLAGFPHTALDTYLPKIVRAGCRVAICE